MLAAESGSGLLVQPAWIEWHILLAMAHSTRSKLAARASRCRTPLQAFSRASQAERPSRSPASASRCSCPSSERKRSRHAAKLVCPTCDCGAHQQLVDPLDARVGSLHPRDERSSHLEFGWSRGRMAPIVAATSEPRIRGAIPCVDFTGLHTNNQVNPGQRASKRFSFLVLSERPLWWASL
jgi:hypothetical protein